MPEKHIPTTEQLQQLTAQRYEEFARTVLPPREKMCLPPYSPEELARHNEQITLLAKQQATRMALRAAGVTNIIEAPSYQGSVELPIQPTARENYGVTMHHSAS